MILQSLSFLRESDQDGKLDRFQPQPIPDFLRWFETEELHYLSIERTKEVIKAIKDLSILPELFLPTKILDTVLRITEEVSHSHIYYCV